MMIGGDNVIGKGKFVPVLFITEHHVMKTYWGIGGQLHVFLTSALDGGEWPASRPSRFTPRERVSGTHWIGGWVGTTAGLDAVVKRKIPSPCRHSNPRSSSITMNVNKEVNQG
jgi:hypothetical protein